MAIRSAIGTYTTRNGDQDAHSYRIQNLNSAELLVKMTDMSHRQSDGLPHPPGNMFANHFTI